MLTLSPDDRAMLDGLAESGDAIVARAIGWCAINSGSRNLAGLDEMALPLVAAMEAIGPVERRPLPDTQEVAADGTIRAAKTGDALMLRVRPEAPVQIALTGHYDTVYPAETRFCTVMTRVSAG